MPELNVIVRGKIAQGVKGQYAVCENSDYTVKFDFDDDWRSQKYKTARFIWNDKYEDVVFEGDECSLPIVSDTYCLKVGVFAGDLQTTTPAIIVMKKSILCGSATAEKPSEDVYSQIMALLNDLKELSGEELAAAIEKYLTEHPIGGGASTAEDISYTLPEDVQTTFPDIVELESDTVKSGLDVAMYYALAGMFAKYISCDLQSGSGETVSVDLQRILDGFVFPAMFKAHEHDNKSVLDLISVVDGKLRYNGSDVGLKGDKGSDGKDGSNGITPIIGTNGNWYLGTTDTGKPSRGEKGDKGADGANGKDGAQGEKGADGKTPVKGTDYWTAVDKQEIVNSVIAALPTWTGGSY